MTQLLSYYVMKQYRNRMILIDSFLQQAIDMVETVENSFVAHFGTKPLLPCQLIRDREFQLINGNDL